MNFIPKVVSEIVAAAGLERTRVYCVGAKTPAVARANLLELDKLGWDRREGIILPAASDVVGFTKGAVSLIN